MMASVAADLIGTGGDQALAADRPTVLDDMASAVLKGDPNGWHLMYQGARTKLQEFIPH